MVCELYLKALKIFNDIQLNIYVHLVYPPSLVSENMLDISDGDDDFLRTECIIVQTLWIAPV